VDERRRGPRSTIRRRQAVAIVSLLSVLGVGLGGLADAARADDRSFLEQLLYGPTTTTTAKPKPKTPVPASIRLATPAGEVPAYDQPGGKQIGVAGRWYGYQQSMPILESRSGWYKVMLPERPNGKSAWIRSSYVAVTRSTYRIVIRRGAKSLTLYKDGWPQWTAPVGLGVAKTPTPLGSFYIGAIEHDPSPGYGPFQLNTTGHSTAIQSWQGSGDAVTAIHGPINAKSDRAIGSSGVYISNGCVRMHLADLQRLSAVTMGTPVDIVP
jgi:lipoprotein-anchoring transpeptidase ErfK/SrfK